MIKKIIVLLFIAMFLSFHYTYVLPLEKVSAESGQLKEGEKWGELAIKEVQEKYKGVLIKEYQYIWHEEKKDGTGIKRFKFLLRHFGKEFGVYVTISYDVQSEEVKEIQLMEVVH
ncbi:DUF3889 domain-containing protein [Cytobacillus suaedae]|nr:DUF3889 domain-containing protein [Cytobacillus suaedae]